MAFGQTKRSPRGTGLKEHAIRFSDGSIRKLTYGRTLAIKLLCTECLGFEGDPKECTSKTCPLYPFRGRTLASRAKEVGGDKCANAT